MRQNHLALFVGEIVQEKVGIICFRSYSNYQLRLFFQNRKGIMCLVFQKVAAGMPGQTKLHIVEKSCHPLL